MKDSCEHLLIEHRADVATAWRRLERLTTEFVTNLAVARELTDTIRAEPVMILPPIYAKQSDIDRQAGRAATLIGFKKPHSPKEGLRRAAMAYEQLAYRANEAANRSVRCYGAIGVPLKLIKEAKQLNGAKDALKEALAPLGGRTKRVKVKEANGTESYQMRDLVTVMMRSIQSGRVNLLAAYRHIPVFDEQVRSIAFHHIIATSVEQKTAGELMDKIAEGNYKDRQHDIAKLAKLPEDEPLSCRKNGHGRLTVRITATRHYVNEETGRKRLVTTTMPAELPVLFPIHPNWPVPDISLPTFKRYNQKGVENKKKRKGRVSELESSDYIKTWSFRRKRKDIRELERRERDKDRKKKGAMAEQLNDLFAD